jgi:hypothetical protein
MDFLELGLSAVITGLTVFISGYAMFIIGKNNVKNEIIDFISSEEGQKFIYGLGALAANGAKAGFGLTKGGGKFGFKDLLMGIAGKWLEKSGIFGGPPEQEQPLRMVTQRHKSESPLDR